jgi:hypothetical protein
MYLDQIFNCFLAVTAINIADGRKGAAIKEHNRGNFLMKRLTVVIGAVAGFAAIVGLSNLARADIYTISDCSNGLGCGTGNNFGTVTTSDISGGVNVHIVLNSDVRFYANFDPAIMFSLAAGIGTVTFGGTYTNYTPVPGGTQLASVFSPDGIGTFNHGLFDTNENGFKGSTPGPLDFQVLASGLTTASFVPGIGGPTGNPLFFAFDVGIGCDSDSCTNTGFAAATYSGVPGPIVGAGLPGLVVACGGLLGLARRRRQQMA